MPIMSCRRDGLPGFKWGESGHCYTYKPGSKSSKERARQKALRQMRAIKHSQSLQHTFLRADLQHMAQSEVETMVPPDALALIKETDPNPLFKVFSVGHEGKAAANKVGFGQISMQYFKDVIRKLSGKILPGLQVFNRHAATNEHAGRKQIGEVVASTLKEINKKLHSIVAVHIYPEHKEEKYDIASIETNVTYRKQGDTDAVAVDIDDVTGIALSTHDVDMPGFPGATLLGAFQAFSDKLTHKKEGVMTLEELKAAITEGDFLPSDVFSEADLKKDPCVEKVIRSEKQTEYEHMGKQLDASEAKVKDLVKATTLSRSKDVFSSLAADRKLTEAQKAFIERNLGRFETEAEGEDDLKKDLGMFTDDQLKEFESISKILGAKTEEPEPAKEDGHGGTGDKPVKGDLTDPDVNPVIPGGKAALAAAAAEK